MGFSAVSAGLSLRQQFSATGGTASLGSGGCTFVVASAKKALLAPTEDSEFILDTAGSDVPTLLAVYTSGVVDGVPDVPILLQCAKGPIDRPEPVQIRNFGPPQARTTGYMRRSDLLHACPHSGGGRRLRRASTNTPEHSQPGNVVLASSSWFLSTSIGSDQLQAWNRNSRAVE